MNNNIKINKGSSWGGVFKLLTSIGSGTVDTTFNFSSPFEGYLIEDVLQVRSGDTARATVKKNGTSISNSGAVTLSNNSVIILTTFITDVRDNLQDTIVTSITSRWGDVRNAYVVPTQPTINTCEFLLLGTTHSYTVKNKSCIVSITGISKVQYITMTTNNKYYKLTENSSHHCYYFPKAGEINFTLANTYTSEGVGVAVYEF